MDKIKRIVRKYALDNARKHNGRATQGPVIGGLIAEMPAAKEKLKDLDIKSIIESVNELTVEEQTAELQKLAPEMLEKKKTVETKELKDLPDAKKGKVVMRIAPSPSGPLHIGHSFVLSLNHEYCKKYNGKFILRIDDTNPENIYGPAYDLIPADANWLTGDNVDSVICQSDRMDSYYKHAKKMIEKGAAYVCMCDADTFREMISKKKACPCRNNSVKEQIAKWESMFQGFQPGEAVMRIKTKVDDPNPALRDWPAFRINDHEHARHGTEYRVWPLMNFAVAVDDHELGVTHTLRGMDHLDNERRQAQIYDFFKWPKPKAEYFGRINFEGLQLSTTETKKKIEYGEYDGWDDIRLPTLMALRRRGYQPGAFIKFAKEMGINKSSKTVPKEEFFKLLDAFNRDIIDPEANRYFFVADPVEVKVEGAPAKECKIPIHPDYPKRGTRKLKSMGKFLIAKNDFDKLKTGQLYRLMDCCNFKKEGKKLVYAKGDVEEYRAKGKGILHWLPDGIDVSVLMPDGKEVKGKGEASLAKLKEGAIVQFERFGFVRLDNKKEMRFWYAHN
ncbi:glutamate--tRNA ligase [Candidatus Woesearchaeota archaeon]|nr:glutamate--tRNA ligase [Candidatus Woesearchaeota archaeon]